ncbi:TetR/AcrR family transcriptional regulator [Amycolatopsis alkalitolerans]|uniref:TetR family transcriptional regulator n=1 Tax=Amycolatopsis alkalitolerans TaxID=2547244 RepID=A0A5C4M2Y5_9PSEU|nr:TetR family transcriptional regulator [Amycolatopsis alkalitolerans]TNC26097.1 TetR family transcriptional regulator [Amycolatopsis alkalitolerans]
MTAASTPKGERRRAALVEAAAELLVEGGFDAIRHRAVAERAGLPLASTTYYFDTLEDLVTAAVDHSGRYELARGREQLAKISTEPRAMDTVIELALDQLLGEDSTFDAVLARYERLVTTGRRPYLRPVVRALQDEFHVLLKEIFARSGKPIDDERVHQLVALVDGAVVNALIEADPDPRAAAHAMLRDALT